ncbi:MAG: glycine cleavage system protein R [Akkermansiaceae bacterium]
MSKTIVLSIHAHDRPGIMSRLSNTIADNGGNWLESRMARLAGQFAGIVRVELEESTESFTKKLQPLEEEGIHVIALDEGDLSDYPYTHCIRVDIFGNDRPGIVGQLTKTISSAGANIEELNSKIESAAMSGHPVFHATGTVCLPDNIDDQELVEAIENLSDDLTVEINGM